jgi:hypothetical protein
MKKHLLIALGLLLAVCAEARIVHIGNDNMPYTAEDGDTLTTNGLYFHTDKSVYIAKGATVTLQNFKVVKGGWGGDEGAIICQGNATIFLRDKNFIIVDTQGGEGIKILKKATVTIKGDGYLKADGRGFGNHYVVWSVGIGCADWRGGGNIIIEDCTIDAYGSKHAPGIGMANDYKYCYVFGVGTRCDESKHARFGNITIKNANIRAVGGEYSAGIGGAADCIIGDITITGGQITAIGQGRYSPAIGVGGSEGECDQININDVKCLQVQCDPKSLFSIGAGHKDTGCGTVVVQGTLYNNGGMKATSYIEPAWDCDFSKLEIPLTLQPNMLYSGKLPYSEKITIPAGATVYFNNVDINGDGTLDESESPFAGITCEGDAEIIFSGKNTIRGFDYDYPGIFVPQGSTLILRGGSKDSLIVIGGKDTDGDGAAGIGAYWREYSTEELPHAGNVKIISGNVLAYGGNGSAGIGGSYNSDCGNIEILGGNVMAIGGEKAAGIGGGSYRSICGNITISGKATVTATHGNDAPYSVGVGANGGCGPITVGTKEYAYGIEANPFSYVAAWDGNLNTLKKDVTVYEDITITGTLKVPVQITIEEGVTVKLNNANINGDKKLEGYASGLSCHGNATIILQGNNVVNSSTPYGPGIRILKDKTLTIKAIKDGSLNAGVRTETGITASAAGIGASDASDCGNIIIESGIITATGSNNGAGIGGTTEHCGNIEIKGGTIVATAGKGAAIGTGWAGNCGNITISGGDITATSEEGGAAIGCGIAAVCGNITITDDVTKVVATAADGTPHSIGLGHGSECGKVVVGGVTYTGGVTKNPFIYPPTCPTPTNLKAGTILETSATVSWTPGNQFQKKWLVMWKRAESDSYTGNSTTTSPTYTIPNLVPSQQYLVKVRALCDDENESEFTEPITIITPAETDCAMPQNIKLSNVYETTATVSWDAGKSYHSEWMFLYKKASDAEWTEKTLSSTSYTMTGLSQGTEYQVLIRTHCGAGSYSPDYEPLTFTTSKPEPACAVPTNLTVTNITESEATLTWTAGAVDDNVWEIAFKKKANDKWKLIQVYDNPTYKLEYLTPESEYEVRIQTFCGAGKYSESTDVVPFTTLAEKCLTPTDFKAEVYGNTVTFSWKPGTEDQTKWHILWKRKSESTWSNNKTVENVTELVAENLMENTEYKAYMYAQCGASDYSSSTEDIFFTTGVFTPRCFTPTDLKVTEVVENEATLTWTTGSANQTKWYVQWKKAEDKNYSFGTTVFTNPTYTLKGLSPETEYTVCVSGLCGKNGDSEVVGPITVTTKSIDEAKAEFKEAQENLKDLISDMEALHTTLVTDGEDANAALLQTAIDAANNALNTATTLDELNAAIEAAEEAYRDARNASITATIKADFEIAKKEYIEQLQTALKPGDSDACHNIVKEAAEDIEELLWDDEKSPDENYDALEALFDKAKADLEAQRQADKEAAQQLAADKAAFEAYKQGIIVAAGALARDEDSEACKALIAKAKNTLNALEYDESKTLEQNKAEVDAVLAKLRQELEAQRASEQQGLENVQGDKVQGTKVIKDGVLYLLYNGTMYNAQGVEVK